MTRKEFNNCVDLYGDRIFGFALKNLRNEEDARDIVQEAFERMWRKHAEVDAEKGRSYLFSTAYHCIIDHLRKVKKIQAHQVSADSNQQAERPDRRLEDRHWIQQGLDMMTEQERMLILLRDYEGYTYEEMASLTGLNLSQVKVYLFRARKKFREWLIEFDRINQVV